MSEPRRSQLTSVFRAFTLSVTMGIAGAIGVGTTAWAQNMPQISVTGTGEIRVAPDMALIQIGVTHEAEQAHDALVGMSTAMEAVLARLEVAGIAREDMQTGSLQLLPRYSNSSVVSSSQIDGFSASATLSVRVLDLGLLGFVLDAVVQDGANQMNGLRFDVQDPGPIRALARRAAVADGQSRAALYADAAGVTLGGLQSLSEMGGRSGPAPMTARMEASSLAVPIAEGEIVISAQVSMVYEVE